jgi:Holliday junction resolvasome RuvABC ATP-dependent DNA helicase subunit
MVTKATSAGSTNPRKSRHQENGVVIYGPQGCGKTTHAAALARHYGKDRIVDDWVPGRPAPADTLALTNACHIGAIHFLDAATAAGIRLMPALKRALVMDRRAA